MRNIAKSGRVGCVVGQQSVWPPPAAAAAAAQNPYGKDVVLAKPKFARIDHCAYPNNTLVGTCKWMTAAAGAKTMTPPTSCADACTAAGDITKCNGLVVVPLANPPTVYKKFASTLFVPAECGSPPAGATHACYALKSRAITPLEREYYATRDPEDPTFYSTCFSRVAAVGFDNAAPDEPIPVRALGARPRLSLSLSHARAQLPRWEFRGKCIPCDLRGAVTNPDLTPLWLLDDVCVHWCGLFGWLGLILYGVG